MKIFFPFLLGGDFNLKYIVDSNILIDFPAIVENDNYELIIPLCVLYELDGLKKSRNSELAFNARRAAVYISNNLDRLTFDERDDWEEETVDDKLLHYAEKYSATLLTNDVYLKVKAILRGIPTKGYSQKDDYCGITYWQPELDDNLYNEELEKLYEEGLVPTNYKEKLYENQYFIAEGQDKSSLGIFKYKDGKLSTVKEQKIKNKWINQIRPRNPEQVCLFDGLMDKNNSLIYAGGGFGKGKSFILNNFALQELEKGNVDKIVYVPNNAFTENTMDIGSLPGDLLPKIEGQIGPLVDLIGIDQIQRMMQLEQLEIVPMGFIRGRSFQNSIIIVNEAQNLTEDHIKLLIARCGEGTRIFFDGDFKQADSSIFRNKNGLKLLLRLKDSPEFSKIFCTVKLIKTERSQTARAAEFLDNIQGIV